MRRRDFLMFVGPSLVSMFLLIALPLVVVLWQSFHLTQSVIERRTEQACDPFGCVERVVDVPVIGPDGQVVRETTFVGLDHYRTMLGTAELAATASWNEVVATMGNLDFYRALRFTLTFTLLTLPLVLVIGLALALAVNRTLTRLRGPVIFLSLLPFIVTPVIGALSIRWLFIGDGILTAGLERLLDREIAMFAQGWTIELLMMFYRVWHVVPFAFVILYAGLQSVSQDALEAAVIDGASRWERLRYVIIPHLAPLLVFIALIHLMDAYRVFEEVIGFSSSGFRISLQWLTFDLLSPDDSGNRAVNRASASAMLTMVGIVIILIPVLRRTWRTYQPTG